jgi:hypothetical protein
MKKKELTILLVFLLCFIAGLFASTVTTVATTTTEATEIKPEEEVVVLIRGAGTAQTAPFAVERPWKIEWNAPNYDYPMFFIWNIDNKKSDSCGGARSGVSYYYTTGKFYIHVISNGPWAIRITYQ